jgi:hypothetical protein
MVDKIRLTRDDLFTTEVDTVVAQQEALLKAMPAIEPTSMWRKILLSSMFFLTVAGTLGGCFGWLLIEPFMNETIDVYTRIESIDLPTMFEGRGRELKAQGLVIYVDDEVTHISGEGDYQGIAEVDSLEPGMPVIATCMISDAEATAVVATRVVVRELTEQEEVAPPPDLSDQSLATTLAGVFAFAIVGSCIAGCIAAADGLVSRNFNRGMLSSICGIGIALGGGMVGLIPGGMVFALAIGLVDATAEGMWTSDSLSGLPMMILVIGRSLTWGILGLTVGLGQGVALRSKKLFLNGLLGGMLGGLIGGMFFDPISKLFANTDFSGQASISRAFGFSIIGLSAGLMIGLVEQLAKDAWLLMRGGPLAGKEFIIYKTPTTIGSSPKCEIYLFKDADVEPRHTMLVKVGNRHEIEDLKSPSGTYVNGQKVQRQILKSGDQIIIGQTALEFSERSRVEG